MVLHKSTLSILIAALLLSACGRSSQTTTPPTRTPQPTPTTLRIEVIPPEPRPSPNLSAPAISATQPAPAAPDLTILYTSDEHGWMSGVEDGQGAAELLGLWQQEYGLGVDPTVLALSGGDLWIGPAISTWFDGEGMVQVMNQMGYSAAAVGNHEFDLGLDVLAARIAEAEFPLLSANLRQVSDGSVPAGLGIQPYTIVQAGELQVGIIGLSATYTPLVANPSYLVDFEFIDYATALREFVPEMRQAGAQVIVLIAHVCPDELELLSSQVADLGIALMGAGHCHLTYSNPYGGSAILSSGANLQQYAFAMLDYDPASGQVTILDMGIEPNQGGQPEAGLAEIIAGWQARTDAELEVEIGYLAADVPEGSLGMQNLITESWLWSYPNADIALTNLGGMRDLLPAGPLTIAELISVMPFNNVLVEVHLTGAEVLSVLAAGRGALAIGGMHRQSGGWVLENSGLALTPNQVYSVLVNDFMYAGGDGYTMLAEADPEAYQTGIDWRQPVIDWVLAQESSPASPLDAAILALED